MIDKYNYDIDKAHKEVQEFEAEREAEREAQEFEAEREAQEFEAEREADTRLERACMALTNLEIELESTDIKLKDYKMIMEYIKCIRHDITELWQDWVDEKY